MCNGESDQAIKRSSPSSILPFNATETELAIESVLSRTVQLPVDIARLWSPQACPLAFLPWLAWALSVDTWDSAWSESTKRSVIASSVQIHRTKGTVAAIERVTAALGITAELQEWFEFDGPAHTFLLTAWVSANTLPDADVLLNPALYRTLRRAIDEVKPVRSHYSFRIGARFGSDLGFAGHASASAWVRIVAEPEFSLSFIAAPAFFAVQFRPVSYLRITMETE